MSYKGKVAMAKQKSDAFQEAYQDCLKQCFNVLTSNLVTPGETPDDAAAKFKKCCENCRKALEISGGVRPKSLGERR
jgi:hypothetical protein